MTKSKLKKKERIDQLFSTDVKIIQNKEVFSYSVDSVLLSRFPKFPSKGLIVDLCSGNGAVGLFASTQTKAKIIEIELQKRLANMAQRSIELNQLQNQVSMINDDLKNLMQYVPRSGVDLIICNPPYFKATKTSKKNLSEHYLLARHEIATNLKEICKVSQQALKTNGRLAIVHRPDRFLEIIATLQKYKLAPKRIQFVYPKLGKEANMLLIEAIKDGSADGLKILPPLIVHKDNGDYTDDVFEIYFGKKQAGKKGYMYVLKCSDNTLYTGYTTDIKKRVSTHNSGKGAKYTKARLPVELIYWEEFPTKEAAMRAESIFKQKTRAQKLNYIEEQKQKNSLL
ncbi:GIY-YIG nuclease family protein [Streptococcus macacae]|uniref:Methyltransferase small domain protein n=1 Tax=Streptococcus macacae NCTC 11558 TaxID=764298 RepID=G5JVT4_9STRE|nr:GIY-YIG nuclease family protein [Streptococcus macacae]EHJ52061.1 methyltransferase small domain protein [Streptococcus macacae NCTC 11558]SUN78926.1 putative O-methyltransferase [Streptococcus macacae NCTC 11558]